MRRNRKTLWLFALLLIVAASGCQRRPLELVYRSTVRVIIKCIWNVEAYPEGMKPTGVTLYFFRDGEYYSSVTTANVDSCEVQLGPGHYNMYMISQSPEEYWRMEFSDMTSYDKASTFLRESESNWATRAVAEEKVVENPEVLCAGVADEFDITDEMTEEYQYYYTNLTKLKAMTATDTKSKADDINFYEEKVEYYTIRIPVYPKNIVSQLWVTVYAGNADVLKSVRASMSGMARTFELTHNTTDADEAIQLINQWSLKMDNETTRVGHIDGIITTFGLPNGETPSAVRDSTLNVSTLLIDNVTTADYKFQVGNKIKIQTPTPGYRNMYRLIFGSVDEPAMILPDVRPDEGNKSGMDATVSPWEDGETIEVPM